MCLQFCTNCWGCVNCVRNGCRVYSRPNKNNNASRIQSAVWSCFLRRYVTMNETWIHYYTPEIKRSSAEWTAAGESHPKRPKTQQWAGKVMASVFWDAHGILFIEYLKKGKTINIDYHMALLDRLSAEIKKNGLTCKRKNRCSTKTMHRATSPWKRWSNWMNEASNCFLTHHIVQIWSPVTTGSLLIWKNAPGRDI